MNDIATIILSKFKPPSLIGCIERLRLLESCLPSQFLALQGPTGTGKSVLLAQWLEAMVGTTLFYGLDEMDADGSVFASHLIAGMKSMWPDWQPTGPIETDPRELAVQLVNEAEVRPPVALALDNLEWAFGQPFLADFLAVLTRYAPPNLRVAVATRAPLLFDPGSIRQRLRLVRAAELAFTPDEAGAWLGPGDWNQCLAASGGMPIALELWHGSPDGWRSMLSHRMVAERPPHVAPEMARALTEEWLSGGLPLESFTYQMSCGQPAAEQLWSEVAECRRLYADHPPAARQRLNALWETTRGRGDRPLMGAVALLEGEICQALGEYGQAMEWYRLAFEAEPELELTGAHAIVMILRDQGQIQEAEALARRCIEARSGRGDLLALGLSHLWYGIICMELHRLEEAEAEFLEARKLGGRLFGDPVVTLLSTTQLAMLQLLRGDALAGRRLAEEAYAQARGRWRWFEALCGIVLAGALSVWGEHDRASQLRNRSLAYLSEIGAKWYLHVLLTVEARVAWQGGRQDQARSHFDQALGLAAREGYVQYLCSPGSMTVPLVCDAIRRGVETSLCGELVARMGERILPALVEMAGQPDPQARRTVVYPLAAIGGDQPAAVLRALLLDEDEVVRDLALLALKLPATQVTMTPLKASGSPEAATPVPAILGNSCRVRVAILGPVTVQVDGTLVAKWRTAKARDLLAYLLLAEGRPVTRDQVMEALWPEGDPQAVQSLLHTSVYYLRRTIEQKAGELITFAGGAYRLNLEQVDLDLERFLNLTAAGDVDGWQAAVRLYRGDLLEGLDYPWCESMRTRMRNLYLECLRKLASRFQRTGQMDQAIHFLQMLIQVDPLAEEAHLGLMECFAGQGNRGAALEQYRTLLRLLDDELGVSPGERAQQLYRKLID